LLKQFKLLTSDLNKRHSGADEGARLLDRGGTATTLPESLTAVTKAILDTARMTILYIIMKVKILTANLQGKLSFLNHAISTKNQLPILLNILIETQENPVKLSSTDLEIGMEVIIPAEIEEVGATTVPAKIFTELISSLSEETVTLSASGTTLEVSSKRTKSVLQTIKSDEFPKLYENKGELFATLQVKDIQKDFSAVVFSASQDTARPALSGVLVRREPEGLLLVATDGYRLSLKHYKVEVGQSDKQESFIIPARVLREILSFKETKDGIRVYTSSENNQVLFESNDMTLVGRLIEAEFPNFAKIIPSDFSVSIAFEREELQRAVKVCSIFARDAANIIKLSLQKDHILVSSQSSSVGENSVRVEAKLDGEENEIAFNSKYLVDVLGNVDEKNLIFEMTGPLNPGVFKFQGDNSFLHLIMPIRVQG
jgi:DNA polymerase-3 subunit beta